MDANTLPCGATAYLPCALATLGFESLWRAKKTTNTQMDANILPCGAVLYLPCALATLGWTKVVTVHRTVTLSQLFQMLPFVVRVPSGKQKNKVITT